MRGLRAATGLIGCIVLGLGAICPTAPRAENRAIPAAGQDDRTHQSTYIVPVGPDLGALNWRLLTFEGRRPTEFVGSEGGEIEVITRASMAVLSRSISVDLRLMPCLQWRWRVDESTIPAADLSKRGEDDRPLMVSVGFPFQPDRASFWERVKYTVLRQVSGRDLPGRVLSFVWGGAGRRGDIVASPQLETAGLMRILRPNDTASGTWYDESVDILDEFTRHFGYPPPPLIEIAVLGDSDDTGTQSLGVIEGLRFSASCSAQPPSAPRTTP